MYSFYLNYLLLISSVTITFAVQLAKFKSDAMLNGKTCPANDRVVSLTTTNHKKCAAYCLDDADCLSIFYDEIEGTCHGCKRQPSYNYDLLVTAGIATKGSVKDINTCQDVRFTSINPTTGVYHDKYGVELYCDMDTDGGGWTVFLRRFNGSGDFKQDWISYKLGFGNMHGGEFWFGLEKLTDILHADSKSYQLRVDLEDFYGNTSFAVYQNFNLSDEGDNYRLHVGDYSGTAGDALNYNGYDFNGQQFSTWNVDNDREPFSNCASKSRGGWWYNICLRYAHLTGEYNTGSDKMQWQPWSDSLRAAKMMIREVGNNAS